MEEQKELLSHNALVIIGIISGIVFVVGMFLLTLGYNEAFYVEDPLVRAIFQVITELGGEMGFIMIIAIFYIVYDKRFAKNMVFSLVFSTYLNEFIKEFVKDPRPTTNISSEEEYGYIYPGYGFPSGHTQHSVVIYGYIANEFKDKPRPYVIPIITSSLIFLIAISRIIIGVHDLEDIIGGLLIGIGFLVTFIYLEPILSEKINSLSLSMKITIAVLIPILFFVIGTLLFPANGLGLVNNPPLYTDSGLISLVCGVLLGFSVGYLLENEYIKYEPSELNYKQKTINLFIGIILLLITFIGLGLIIRGNVVLRFIRYTLAVFIFIFVAPLIFTKINRKKAE